jgi:ribulose-phosphate 3-epimerase
VSEAEIVASVLGADYSILGEEAAGVDRIQWAIMDGRFVPHLTFGADVVAACRAWASVPFEAHLMVEDPDPWLEPFAEAGCEAVLVHQEACRHLHRTLARTRSLGIRSGVALNPATPLEAVRHVLDQVDVLLVMTVNPGFGGQAYLQTMEAKITEARHLIRESGVHVTMEVDGDISAATARRAREAGAEWLVAGSAILAHPEGKKAAVTELRRSLTQEPA